MPKTLVVPVDGSETAERGLVVAQMVAAKLDPCDIVLVSVDVDDGERMRPYAEALAARDPGATRVECPTGDPADQIIEMLEREPEAAVCMTTRGRGRVAAPMLGSVATTVVRSTDRPVLLVGPDCESDWWHEPALLAACWTGPESDAILDPAESWSRALGMDLALLCVFHPLDVQASVEPRRQFEPALERLGEDAHRVTTIALFDEYPPGAIVDWAGARPAAMLALTTHARTGIGRAVLGSVAMDVVHRSPCPVLVVRRRP